MKKVVQIEFPLRGEWCAPTSPAHSVPSHGTNRMGLRYAFDFLKTVPNNADKFYNCSFLRFALFGVPLERCYCWGEKVYAPCDGEIVSAVDGVPERKTVHWLRESIIAIRTSLSFNEFKDDYRRLAGNYILMKCSGDAYMLFAHLKTNSIEISKNQKIKKGTILGEVGHSGNSTSPHLHFQVMDRADIKNAKGIPCSFNEYERYEKGTWKKVYNQIPTKHDRFRFQMI